MIFIIPEVLIVLLLIGIAYLPPIVTYFIIGYIIFCMLLHRYWESIILKIEKNITKLKFWRRKDDQPRN